MRGIHAQQFVWKYRNNSSFKIKMISLTIRFSVKYKNRPDSLDFLPETHSINNFLKYSDAFKILISAGVFRSFIPVCNYSFKNLKTGEIIGYSQFVSTKGFSY